MTARDVARATGAPDIVDRSDRQREGRVRRDADPRAQRRAVPAQRHRRGDRHARADRSDQPRLVLGNQVVFGSVNANPRHFAMGIKDFVTHREGSIPARLNRLLTIRIPWENYDSVVHRTRHAGSNRRSKSRRQDRGPTVEGRYRLSATTGSTRNARRAGSQLASNETASSVAADAIQASGSHGLTSNSTDAQERGPRPPRRSRPIADAAASASTSSLSQHQRRTPRRATRRAPCGRRTRSRAARRRARAGRRRQCRPAPAPSRQTVPAGTS